MDIFETGQIVEFIAWVNEYDHETLKVVAPELQIVELEDGSLWLELLPNMDN